ncbi:MAG: hypothetical protein IT560_14555 [Alphaproteobacteria bacterium]|jgi:hypothetical protein|nr:hypothetical protein [Alphaproteobacteria bacterium]
MTSPAEAQDALYRAAKDDDRLMVAHLLKEMFAAAPYIPRDDLGAYYATIDAVTPKMAHMSLLVLSLQAGATGLFRYLAEQKPDDTQRIAASILPVMGRLEFVEPLAALGGDPQFMSGALLAKATERADTGLLAFMIAQGADPNSTAHMQPPRHPLAVAAEISDMAARRAVVDLLLSAGADWQAMPEQARKAAQESYSETRQADIAQESLRNLKQSAQKRSLKPPTP